MGVWVFSGKAHWRSNNYNSSLPKGSCDHHNYIIDRQTNIYNQYSLIMQQQYMLQMWSDWQLEFQEVSLHILIQPTFISLLLLHDNHTVTAINKAAWFKKKISLIKSKLT